MQLLRRLTPAAQLPLALSLEEAKLHLRFDPPAEGDPMPSHPEDALITDLIRAVAQTWETYVKLPLMRAEYLVLAEQLSGRFDLGAGDIVAVESVKYLNPEGVAVEVEASRYGVSLYDPQTLLFNFGGAGLPRTAGHGEAVQIRFSAGAATSADVDPLRKQALKLLLAHYYENRGDTRVPPGAQALMDLERMPTL